VSEKKKLTYARAVQELEKIISEIETENIDVDVLTEKVKRATHLIKFCKGSLRATEEGVRKALSEIEEKPEEGEPGEPEDADAEPF
jgi:exodeoxyribonuclease VII small subunit